MIDMKSSSSLFLAISVSLLLVIAAGSAQVFATDSQCAEKDKEEEKEPTSRIFFDKGAYNAGRKATVTLVDKNLDRHHDGIDTYQPQAGFIFLEIGGKRVSDSFADETFARSFTETGANTGVFKAILVVPSTDEYGGDKGTGSENHLC